MSSNEIVVRYLSILLCLLCYPFCVFVGLKNLRPASLAILVLQSCPGVHSLHRPPPSNEHEPQWDQHGTASKRGYTTPENLWIPAGPHQRSSASRSCECHLMPPPNVRWLFLRSQIPASLHLFLQLSPPACGQAWYNWRVKSPPRSSEDPFSWPWSCFRPYKNMS